MKQNGELNTYATSLINILSVSLPIVLSTLNLYAMNILRILDGASITQMSKNTPRIHKKFVGPIFLNNGFFSLALKTKISRTMPSIGLIRNFRILIAEARLNFLYGCILIKFNNHSKITLTLYQDHVKSKNLRTSKHISYVLIQI